MGDFRKLRVWQKAKALTVKIYQLTKVPPILADFGYKDQIQRAAVSISVNIAEGDELSSNRQAIRHFYIAKGSSAELQTLIMIGNEIGYIEDKTADELIDESKVISYMLAKVISARTS